MFRGERSRSEGEEGPSVVVRQAAAVRVSRAVRGGPGCESRIASKFLAQTVKTWKSLYVLTLQNLLFRVLKFVHAVLPLLSEVQLSASLANAVIVATCLYSFFPDWNCVRLLLFISYHYCQYAK